MAVNTWSFTNIQQVQLTGLAGRKSWTAIAPATVHGSAILTDNQDGSADGDVIPGATASLTASGYSLSGSIVTLQGTTSGGDALIATGGNFYMLQSAATSWTAAYPANTITGADLFCFEKTTFILTPDGEVQVSELKIGDEILNAANEAVKIEWIGHQKNIHC